MAGIPWTADTGALTLTSATALTALQLVAASNVRDQLTRLDISSNGITPTDAGILIDVLVQSTAGTMSALTPVKSRSSDSETLQLTAQKNASGEPTAGNILFSFYYNEQTWVPIIFDPPLDIVGGTRLGVRATPGTLTGTVKIVVTASGLE